jgi:ABC-2 type transport system permease protein
MAGSARSGARYGREGANAVRTFIDLLRSDWQMWTRNRQALFWTFFFPVLLMGLMGVVFGNENAFQAKLAIVNQDGSEGSKLLVTGFRQVKALKVSELRSEAVALAELRNGTYSAVLVLPKGMSTKFVLDAKTGGITGQAKLPFYYDNSSLIQAGTVQGVVDQVVQQMGYLATKTKPAFMLQPRGVAAKGFKYIDFLVPGIVAMSLMTTGIYGISGTFVTYRERGVLRRLKATPMPLGSFISSRVLMQLFVALLQAGLVLATGSLLFHVHVGGAGTWLQMAVLAILGSASFVTIGFFVASVSKNIEIAAALSNVIGTPMMFLSGIFFPMDSAPHWIQPVVHAMPLKYLADAMRAVIIQGHSLGYVWLDMVVLVGVALVFLAFSVRFFKWE